MVRRLEGIELFKGMNKKNIKLPVTGPYTLMDWSFNDHYKSREDGFDKLKSMVDARNEVAKAL